MLNEITILLKNIKNIRKGIINEGVSENTLIDAINNHKIIYIYYAGDETVLKGYRTIRPFVIGTHKKTGNKVLRAWQDAGSSDSYRGLNRTPRMGHEKHSGPKGIKPGWRLFKVDLITSVMPTGKDFNPREYFVTGDGVKYNPQDSDMSAIDAAIEITPKKDVKTSGFDSMQEPDVVAAKVDNSFFDKQGDKYKQFYRAGQKARQITKDEIMGLWLIATKHRKESTRKFWVVQDQNGDMVLKNERQIESIPPERIVGNLKDLYNKFVLPDKKAPKDFFNKIKNNLQNRE